MRVIVDDTKCTGHGRCASVAPDIFVLDDEGRCAISDVDVPAEFEAQARSGANNCPERAITVVATPG